MPRPPLVAHRTSSDVSHVSDSEPEREAHRLLSSGSESSPASSPKRIPLGTISNTSQKVHICCPNFTGTSMDTRLAAVEEEMSKMRDEIDRVGRMGKLAILKRKRSPSPSPTPSTPPNKYPRTRDIAVGSSSPLGRLDEPLIHRSSLLLSTPEREENSRDASLMLRELQLRVARQCRSSTAQKSSSSVGNSMRRKNLVRRVGVSDP
ncbi:hypothetical protein C8R45DRAFT_1028248 [Mycena sanguinolenta]|nr:hypothetical protein C8R45DRAFT_1028248 [Mycena sanguinolenta]